MTTVYYTSCKKLPHHAYEKAVSLLPLHMQQKIKEYRRWQDAHAYLYGKLLLRTAISQLGCTNSLENMKITKYGKPYFNDSDFGFNISHSGAYIVCVISTDEKYNIGIDIEEVKPIVIENFKSVFSEEEKREINSYDRFYTFWTRKEAVAKADGRGLLIPLKTINTLNLSVLLNHKMYNLYKANIDEKYRIYIASSVNITDNIEYIYQSPHGFS